jgi:hypothetical protein
MRRSSGLALLLLLVLIALAIRFDSQPTPATSGEIYNSNGPVENALVRFKGRAENTLSDGQGRFRLPPDPHARRVTAWKPGFLIAGAPLTPEPLRLLLHPLPNADNPDYDWISPDADPRGEHNCANCHQEIHREWNESAHARSATGRRFRDLYIGTGGSWSLLGQHPEGAGVCAACHAPTVKAGDRALFNLGEVQGVAARGVHCDYCHKVTGNREDTFGLSHGRDVLTLLRPKQGQLFFGPLDDVDRGEDAYSAFYKDSRYCASCHEGVVFGVHVYSTYSEWRDSPARQRGQQCQDCHMKPTGKMTNIAPGRGGIERDPQTLGNHRFFAGSRADMLRQCLKVSADIKRDEKNVQVEVVLRVDGAGHRVPTGFIDRHLILSVEGRDDKGAPLDMTAGPRLPSAVGAELAARPGLLYAKLLRDEEGRSPAPFWKSDLDPIDTRLRPGQEERGSFRFPSGLRSVQVKVIHRRFWREVAKAKGWPEDDIVVFEKCFPVE